MSKNITIKEGAVARNFTGVKKLQTNVIGGGNQLWIPEDEAADYCTFKKITLRQNGTVKAEDNACDGFSEVTVDIPADLKEKVITDNGEYIAADDNCAGYSKVTVNVSGGGSGSGQHTVIFYAYDRVTILDKQTVEDGGGATYYGATPTSPGMRFVGWSPNPLNVKADMNVYPKFENLIYNEQQIDDDWVTIAQNVQANPDYYPIGSWKLLELNPLPYAEMNDLSKYVLTESAQDHYDLPSVKIRMQLVAKGVDELEGRNGYANTTWVAMDVFSIRGKDVQFWADSASSCWVTSKFRAFLQDQFTTKIFPQELLSYIKRVIKYSVVRFPEDLGKSYPAIDWFWIPSLREMFGACTDKDTTQMTYNQTYDYYMESYGAIYDIFCKNAQGQLDTIANTKAARYKVFFNSPGQVAYNLRTNDYGHMYNTVKSHIGINSSATVGDANIFLTNGAADVVMTAGSQCICFCL